MLPWLSRDNPYSNHQIKEGVLHYYHEYAWWCPQQLCYQSSVSTTVTVSTPALIGRAEAVQRSDWMIRTQIFLLLLHHWTAATIFSFYHCVSLSLDMALSRFNECDRVIWYSTVNSNVETTIAVEQSIKTRQTLLTR